MKRLLLYGSVALFAGLFVWKGIIPAFTGLATDFPNYYTASKLVLEGADLSRLYDDAWFDSQIKSHGMEIEGKFSPFPPLTMFLMIPVAFLPPEDALRVWTCINVAALLGVFLLLRRITGSPPAMLAAIILSAGAGLANNVRFGQWYVILLLLMCLGFTFWKNGAVTLAGIMFGIGAAIKYFPILYLAIFLVRREWKGVAACLGTIALLNLVGVLLAGAQVYRTFFQDVLFNHLSGHLQNPFSASFQSWQSLFRRLFVPDAALNPSPFVNWPSGLAAGTTLIAGSVLVYTLDRVFALQKDRTFGSLELQFALVTIMGLVLLPASATYHFVLLILPIAVLFARRDVFPGRTFFPIAMLYVALGYIPYHLFAKFDGEGILSIIAYPRLIVMTLLFALSIRQISRFLSIAVPEPAIRS